MASVRSGKDLSQTTDETAERSLDVTGIFDTI